MGAVDRTAVFKFGSGRTVLAVKPQVPLEEHARMAATGAARNEKNKLYMHIE